MQAKVITSFSGKPDDEILARTIAVDEIITGDLAAVAVGLGWASDLDAPKGKKARQAAAVDPDLEAKRAAAQQAVDTAAAALATAQAAEQAADEASKADAAKAVSDAQAALDAATAALANLG